jgi:spore maturation protein CgeB
MSYRIVILGLSITSSWGNGHATTYRALVREMVRRGHDVLFLERDVPWYAAQRDMPRPPYGRTMLYKDFDELEDRFAGEVRRADVVMVGSFVPEGVVVGRWVTEIAQGPAVFYDIDTPVTLTKLSSGDYEYLSPNLISRYDLYLSFSGGPTLKCLAHQYGARQVRAFPCSVDPEIYYPEQQPIQWDLGYMGTYSPDRQPPLERLLVEPARRWRKGRFIVAGPQYPESICWPDNVQRVDHLPPDRHRAFYNSQRYTLNVTRQEMIDAGYSPSVRLFEAAACGTPIITDYWPGLETYFTMGREILIAQTPKDSLRYLHEISEEDRCDIAYCARKRVLAEHTAERRVEQLEGYLDELIGPLSAPEFDSEEKVGVSVGYSGGAADTAS